MKIFLSVVVDVKTEELYVALLFGRFLPSEIAEEYEVSRQAVYDNIKRTEAMLEQYEEKLLLLKKFQERKEMFNKLKELASGSKEEEEITALIEALEKLD